MKEEKKRQKKKGRKRKWIYCTYALYTILLFAKLLSSEKKKKNMSLDNSVKQTQIHSIRYRSCVAVFQLLHVIAQVFVRGNVRAEKPYCVYAPPPPSLSSWCFSVQCLESIYIHRSCKWALETSFDFTFFEYWQRFFFIVKPQPLGLAFAFCLSLTSKEYGHRMRFKLMVFTLDLSRRLAPASSTHCIRSLYECYLRNPTRIRRGQDLFFSFF